MNEKNILVEFYEDNNESPFASSDIPKDQLPDTFKIETKLAIAGQNWSVTNAMPETKEEFIKSGKLKIYLKKIETVDPKDILFSMPTINNDLCEIIDCETQNLYLINEDDWRQIELIEEINSDNINEELAGIENIYKNHYVEGVGFNKIFIREKVEAPLSGNKISLDALKQELNVTKNYDGFSFYNANGMAKNSFAFEIENSLIVYGLTSGNHVIFLCISGTNALSNSLLDFMKKTNLVCVNWCKMEIIKLT